MTTIPNVNNISTEKELEQFMNDYASNNDVFRWMLIGEFKSSKENKEIILKFLNNFHNNFKPAPAHPETPAKDESQLCDQSEDDNFDYHLTKIKAIQNHFKNGGELTAKVFLRATGAFNDGKGSYVINEKDLFAWFENGDHLKTHTTWDTI